MNNKFIVTQINVSQQKALLFILLSLYKDDEDQFLQNLDERFFLSEVLSSETRNRRLENVVGRIRKVNGVLYLVDPKGNFDGPKIILRLRSSHGEIKNRVSWKIYLEVQDF